MAIPRATKTSATRKSNHQQMAAPKANMMRGRTIRIQAGRPSHQSNIDTSRRFCVSNSISLPRRLSGTYGKEDYPSDNQADSEFVTVHPQQPAYSDAGSGERKADQREQPVPESI